MPPVALHIQLLMEGGKGNNALVNDIRLVV
jgi:hypothetical protein